MMGKTVIIIPAHNEEKTVGEVVKKAKKYGSVVVVDDASRDGTLGAAKKAGATVVRHPANRGLGGALRTGFETALKMGADVIVTIDADGQHKPEEIPQFVGLINGGYDFVLGVRDLREYPFVKKLGNFFLNNVTNFISGTDLKDTESGFRAFSADALRKLYLKADRYEIAVEIVFEVGRNKLRTINVPISSPVYVKGVGVRDGVKNFRYLMRRRKRSFRGYVADFKYVMKNKINS